MKTKKKSRNNPHGVNQYTGPDPRQALYLSLYLDPNSPTFGNSYQSAIGAKYSEEYAQVMSAQMPAWLSDNLGDLNLLQSAVTNLKYFLELNPKVQAMGAFGPLFHKEQIVVKKKLKNGRTKKVKKTVNGKPIMVLNGKLLEVKQKTTHFIAERVGKKRFGNGGSDGLKRPDAPIAAVQININEDRAQFA